MRWQLSLFVFALGCGASAESAPPPANPGPDLGTAPIVPNEASGRAEGMVSGEASRPLLSAFLGSLATRFGDALYVRDAANNVRVHCADGVRQPICQQCYQHGFDAECGPSEQQSLCGNVGPYAQPAANQARVQCAPDSSSCWLDRPALGNAPSGDRATWFFEPDGNLLALVHGEFGAHASLDVGSARDAARSACGFHAALRDGSFASEHVGVFVHRWSLEFDDPGRNLERHLCGEGVAEFAGEIVRGIMQGDSFDSCGVEPLRCAYGLDHAALIAFGRDQGEGHEPRYVFYGLATTGGPLDDGYEEQQEQDVIAFLARVVAGQPAPRRRDRPYGVPALPATVRDCR